jgi:hypothetical protein
MHALICAAAGLTVSLTAASVSNAAVRGNEARLNSVAQFEIMEGLNYTSVWNRAGSERAIPATETYDAAMLAQNTTGAFFIDDFPDNFNFSLNQDGGANLITGAATRVDSWQTGNVVTVAAFTADSSDWLPAGVDPGNGGGALTVLRFDVGAFAAGTDALSYPGYSASHVVAVNIVLFINGAAVFTSSNLPAGNLNLANGLGAVGLVGGAAGAGIDEVHMVFTLNVPTPGAASVFGLAGLAAVRRRRR